MRKLITILFLSLVLIQNGLAQQPVVSKITTVSYLNQVTAGPAIALGRFSETHYGGITVSIIRKKNKHPKSESFHLPKTGWLAAASLSHYFGKKEIVGTTTYRYKNYSLLELNGGAGWYPVKKLDLSLRAGPALGYYNKIFRFTLTGHLQGRYQIGPKTSIAPELAFIKEPGSDALWISSLQLGVQF